MPTNIWLHLCQSRVDDLFGKNAMHETQGIFVGYVESSTTIYKVWDPDGRCFTTSDNLRFRELEFPLASLMDDEPPISVSHQAPYQHPVRTTMAPARPPEIFDEITVQPPPAIRVSLLHGRTTKSQQQADIRPRSPSTTGRDKGIAAMLAEIDSKQNIDVIQPSSRKELYYRQVGFQNQVR
jgi:hypothetical protein